MLDTGSITAADSVANHLNLLDVAPRADGTVRSDFYRLWCDYNGDGVVNAIDRTLFLAHYGTTLGQGLYDYLYDLNGDHVINLQDYMILARRFGQTV
jgi:hypothetical protein